MILPDFVGSVQALPEYLVLGVDTEFEDTHTLTVQVAARLAPDTVVIQIYRSAAIPDLPEHFDPQQYLPLTPQGYSRFCERIVVRPVQPLTPFLSPLVMVRDLLGLSDMHIHSRKNGQQILDTFTVEPGIWGAVPPDNACWNPRGKSWKVPSLNLTLVGHTLRADFTRLFGWKFLDDLRTLHVFGKPRIAIEGRKLLHFIEQSGRYRNTKPILEYVYQGRNFYEVHVEMRDTMFPFGPASLDHLCHTFLGIGKSNGLSEEDKKNMLRTFRDRTADAYGYALTDAINTLLIYEQMSAKDREIYESFGFTGKDIPPLRPFLGGRVSTFFLATTRRNVAVGSTQLESRQNCRALMRKGGVALLEDCPDASKFGRQTGQVHGGLLFNRAPTKLWHEAEGMLADVDMSGCYLENARRINVYWGRPVVLEPGHLRMSVAEAVAMVGTLAPPDGWMLFVSGPILDFANVLIPSTENAITGDNYRAKVRHKRRESARQAFRREAEDDQAGFQGTKLYTAQVDFGVVTQSIWLMIQALPPKVRQQYEQLVVESVLFYPKDLIAEDGTHYDALVRNYGSETLPWEMEFDPNKRQLIQRQKIDAEYVSLRFPLGDYARKVAEFRQEAQSTAGKNSGQDLAWKQHGNTFYGVLASPFHPVNNIIAANLITSMARARAFALSQALNGIQLITDGCTYRRDQIPIIPYDACLQEKADYPSHRAETNGPISFYDPTTIPTNPEDFTAWYIKHAMRFFQVQGTEYESFFSTHQLVHKRTGKNKSATFDALACDGAGNYMKATHMEDGEYRVEEFKARSYGIASKNVLQERLLQVYRTDNLTELLPLVEDRELLSLARACREAKAALEAGGELVYLPLGLSKSKVLHYRIIKTSAFLYKTPSQRQAILKPVQKFEEEHGCGLEVLAFQRTYGKRRKGSVVDVLSAIDAMIQKGDRKLVSSLNLNKAKKSIATVATVHKHELQERKAQARHGFWLRIEASRLVWEAYPRLERRSDAQSLPGSETSSLIRQAYPTALLVTLDDLVNLKEDRHVLPMQSPVSMAHSTTVRG